MVILPVPCSLEPTRSAMIETLERLGRRGGIDGPNHMAEAISFVLWDPESGAINQEIPNAVSSLRLERFSEQVEVAYVNRYKGLPPHTRD